MAVQPRTLRPEPLKQGLEPLLKMVDLLTDDEKMQLRNELDSRLNIEIKNLNLTEELGLQYRQAQILMTSVQSDPLVPPNQKAQIFNSMRNQLTEIIRLREIVFSQERLKRYEGAMLHVLKVLKNDVAQTEFLELYGEYLADKGV